MIIVRSWVESGGDQAAGLVAALRDPRLARALLASPVVTGAWLNWPQKRTARVRRLPSTPDRAWVHVPVSVTSWPASSQECSPLEGFVQNMDVIV